MTLENVYLAGIEEGFLLRVFLLYSCIFRFMLVPL